MRPHVLWFCGSAALKPGCVAHAPLAVGFATFFMGMLASLNRIKLRIVVILTALGLSLVKIVAIRSIA